MNELFLYAGGALPILWGISHLFPTMRVVRGFGRITRDNRLILTMEGIAAEACGRQHDEHAGEDEQDRFADQAAPATTFAASAFVPLTLAAVSAATGGRVDFIMYRLCAPIFTLSAALILTAAFL